MASGDAGVTKPKWLEELSPDGKVVRVNLRPYLQSGGDIDKLFEAFVRTSQEFRSVGGQIELYTEWAELMAVGNEIGLA